MKMIWKRTTTTITLYGLVALGVPVPAHAGGLSPYPVASEYTQISNNVQLVLALAKAAQQYQTQLEQFQLQIKNGTVLKQQMFGPLRSDLTGLQRVVQGGNALSYAMGNLDAQFTSKYASAGYTPSTSYADRYATWSKTSMDTTQKALDAAGLQNNQLDTEETLVEQLEQMSDDSDGQLKAVQVGNQIAAMQTQQLMKLRQLMMADMQSKAAFQAQQISQSDEQQRALGFFQDKNLYIGYSEP